MYLFFSGRRTYQSKFSVDVKQKICDEWLKNSVTTVDRRNGQDCTRIRKSMYLEQYKDLVKECTVRKLKNKLFEKHHISASLGTIYNFETVLRIFSCRERKKFVHVQTNVI